MPLLSITAGQDERVPSAAAAALHQALAPLYLAAPERLGRRDWPESGHMMRRVDWEASWVEAIDWLNRFLA